MLFGSYLRSLDEKNRLVLPSKYREELGFKVFIMKGFDGSLSIYKEEEFEKLTKHIQSLSFEKKDSRAYLRVRLSSVTELDIDKMGRVQIPSELIEKYHISKSVIVLGILDHIEVWDKQAYENYFKEAESSFEDIAENLNPNED